MKKLTAGILAVGVILASPGLSGYEALAGSLKGHSQGAKTGAPTLVILQGLGNSSGIGSGGGLGRSLDAAKLGTVTGLQDAPQGTIARTRLQVPLEAAKGPIALQPVLDGMGDSRAPPAQKAVNAGVKSRDQTAAALEDTAKSLAAPKADPHGVLGALYDKIGIYGASFSGQAEAGGVAGNDSPGSAGSAPLRAGTRDGGARAEPASSPEPMRRQRLAALRGKTWLLVGTYFQKRPFVLQMAKEAAEELGLKLIVVDNAENEAAVTQVIPQANFIAAPVGKRDQASRAELLEKVLAYHEGVGKIDAVFSMINPYVQTAGVVATAIARTGHAVLGHSQEIADNAHEKAQARRLFNAHSPALYVPFEQVNSAQQAGDFFDSVKGRYPGAFIKPERGGGSSNAEEAGTRSEAEQAYQRIDANLKADTQSEHAEFHMQDVYPGILMEALLRGAEVDVEALIQDGEIVDAYVSDNGEMAKDNKVELAFTYPSQLYPEVRAKAIEAAKAMVKALKIQSGNAHIELILWVDGEGELKAAVKDAKNIHAGPIELNLRFGGVHVPESILYQTGVDIIKGGIHSLFGVYKPGSFKKLSDRVLETRLIVSKHTGKLRSVNFEKAKDLPGVKFFRPMAKPGEMVYRPSSLHSFSYAGDISVEGKDYEEAVSRMLAALKAVEITQELEDGTVVTTDGTYLQKKNDINAELRPKARAQEKKPAQKKGGLLAGIRSLPKSFLWGFTPGWTLQAMGQEIMAVALPLFTAKVFGVPEAVLSTIFGFFLRPPGAWLGAWLMKHFNPKWISVATLLIVTLSGALIPLFVYLWATGGTILGLAVTKSVLLGVFMVNSAINGIIYGINRGIGEMLIPRHMIGSGKKEEEKLELGLNYAYQWVELGCIIMALAVAVPLLNLVGGSVMMLIASGVVGLSSVFYAALKYNEPWHKPQPGQPKQEEEKAAEKLGLRDYLPFAFARFQHFMVYGVLSTMYALSVFQSDQMAGNVIGLYDGGSWLLSLLASLALLPLMKVADKNPDGSDRDKQAVEADRARQRKTWTVIMALSAMAFVWTTAFFQIPALAMVLAAVLGGVITINSNKWGAFYSSSMSSDKYKSLLKWMMTASTYAILPIAVALGASRAIPSVGAALTIPMILLGANIFITLFALAMVALLFRGGGGAAAPAAAAKPEAKAQDAAE